MSDVYNDERQAFRNSLAKALGERDEARDQRDRLQQELDSLRKPRCVYNEGWGVMCGKPATHEVRIEGYEDKPQLACPFHASLSQENGFNVRILNL